MKNEFTFQTWVSTGNVTDHTNRRLFAINQATTSEMTELIRLIEVLPEPHMQFMEEISFVHDAEQLKIYKDKWGYQKKASLRIDPTGSVKVQRKKDNETLKQDFTYELGRVVYYKFLRPDEQVAVLKLLPPPSGFEPPIYMADIGRFLKAYLDYLFNADVLNAETPELYQWMKMYLFHGNEYSLPKEWIRLRQLPEPQLQKNETEKTVDQAVPEQAPF